MVSGELLSRLKKKFMPFMCEVVMFIVYWVLWVVSSFLILQFVVDTQGKMLQWILNGKGDVGFLKLTCIVTCWPVIWVYWKWSTRK